MQQQKWWKHPQLIWIYGGVGAIAGVFLYLVVAGIFVGWATSRPEAADGFDSAYSGVSGAFLATILATFDVSLGGLTGAFCVHFFGSYRLMAVMGFIATGLLSSAIGLMLLWEFSEGYGWAAALAVYGINVGWSLGILVLGICLLTREVMSKRSELS